MRSVIVIAIILAFVLAGVYLYRYLLRVIRPRESGGRLVAYIASCFCLVFILSFLMVFFISWLFPSELMK